jgi:hypothetical protein
MFGITTSRHFMPQALISKLVIFNSPVPMFPMTWGLANSVEANATGMLRRLRLAGRYRRAGTEPKSDRTLKRDKHDTACDTMDVLIDN